MNVFTQARAKAHTTSGAPEDNYRQWLCTMMPRHFRGEDQFATHHDAFWNWAWPVQRHERLSPPALLYMANRGGAKSTQVEGFTVATGAMNKRKYVLCVTRTQEQADKHVRSVNSMIIASKVGDYYPDMAKPQLRRVEGKVGQSTWNRQQLTTANGFTIQGFGLLSSQRGIREEEYRPDLVWITDIDNENDSVGMVDTLLAALAGSILGTQSSDCIFVFDQNLIHRDSVINRIYTRKSDVLSDRVGVGPISAINKPEYERKSNKWFILSGDATWPQAMPLLVCESILNTVGKQFWEREYQNNINLAYTDAVYPMWSEPHHVITWSEFAKGFIQAGAASEQFYDRDNRPRLPQRGKIVMAQDWGNGAKHPCANAWCWTPPEEMPFNRFAFFYREMCWPRFPLVEGDDREHPSALQVGEKILEVEREWNEGAKGRMQFRLASHERPEIVQAYRVDMPKANLPSLSFAQIKTANARNGILHMQNFLGLEPDRLHPFRVYPDGHPKAGESLAGCPKVFFIVADGQGELQWDAAMGLLRVAPAIDEHGQARTRFEYPNYRKPDTAQGAERKDAPKIDDDEVDCHRAIAGMLFPAMEKMTADMRVEAAIPKPLQRAEIAKLPDRKAKDEALQSRYFAEHEAKRQIQQQQQRRMNAYGRARSRYPNSF